MLAHDAESAAGLYTVRGPNALVAQRIEHLTTDQKVGGSSPSERASQFTALSPAVGETRSFLFRELRCADLAPSSTPLIDSEAARLSPPRAGARTPLWLTEWHSSCGCQ